MQTATHSPISSASKIRPTVKVDDIQIKAIGPMMPLAQWLMPWDGSWPAAIVLTLGLAAYLIGTCRMHDSAWRRASFIAGILLFYLVTETRFEYLSEHEFFVHRIQHLVLHHLAPFLVVLSRPGASILGCMPATAQASLKKFTKSWLGRTLVSVGTMPSLVSVLFVAVVVFWLIPGIHQIAMLDWRLYQLMNWSVAITGLLFWNLTLPPAPGHAARLSSVLRVVLQLTVIPAQIVVGLLVFLEPHVLYPIYSLCGRAFNDLSPLADQQLGALILWIPASMMSVIATLIIVQRAARPQMQGA
jgi:putative membrane protein